MISSRYEKEAYQFLAAYRFLSYALAVMFTQVGPSPIIISRISEEQVYIILGVLGIYSLFKVFTPLRWKERSAITYLILAADFLLSILLVVYTGGLNSAFLLYSLTPIMTAALLFEEKISLILAAAASLSLSLTHLTLAKPTGLFTPVMQGLNLTLLIVYTLFCFVVALV